MIKADGTADCDACGMPMFPYSSEGQAILLECANRHQGRAPLPRDRATADAVNAWIARRGAQLHVQHERWGTDDERPRNREEEI